MASYDDGDEGCFGEQVGVYIAGPLLSRLYPIGYASSEGMSDIASEAFSRIAEIASNNGSSPSADDLDETSLLFGVIAMTVITEWHMSNVHMCDALFACADKAEEIADVTVASVIGAEE